MALTLCTPLGTPLGTWRGAAYHDCMALASAGVARPVRWPLWLGAGIVGGLSLGFVLGLARPRVRD